MIRLIYAMLASTSFDMPSWMKVISDLTKGINLASHELTPGDVDQVKVKVRA